MTLKVHQIPLVPQLYHPIQYSFCESNTGKEKKFVAQRGNDNKAVGNKGKNYDNRGYKSPQKQQSIESYCELILNWKGDRVNEITNKKEIEHFTNIANKMKFSPFNFALAKLYSKNPHYFQGSFDENILNSLLRKYEDTEQFTTFFNNFVFASCLLTDMSQRDLVSALTFNLSQHIQKMQKIKNAATEVQVKETTIQQAITILRCLPKQYENEIFSNFVTQSLHPILERTFKANQIFEKETLTPEEVQLSLLYFEFTSKLNQELALKNLEQQLQKADFNQTIIASSYVRVYSYLLVVSLDIVANNSKFLLNFLEKSLSVLKENHPLKEKEIVTFFFASGRLIPSNGDSSLNLRILKLFDQLLINKKFENNQLKSLFYSFGKNSFMSQNIATMLLSQLENKSLQVHLNKDRAEQYLSNLILSASNLRLLSNEKITPELIGHIFSVASKLQDKKQLSNFLTQIGTSFLRMGYYNSDFWTTFFQQLPLQKDSYFQTILFDSSKVFFKDMPLNVSELFKEASERFHSINQSNSIKIEDFQHTNEDNVVKQFLDEKKIAYTQSVIVDGIYANFILQDQNKAILIFKQFNYLISQEGERNLFNLSSQFKVDLLTKKGYQVVIINGDEDNFQDKLVAKFSK